MERRSFLKMGALAGGAAVLMELGINVFEPKKVNPKLPTPSPKPANPPEIEYSEEEKHLLDEIIGFRRSLGLDGITPEMEELIKNERKWENGKPFDNEVAEKDRSYGMYLGDTIQALFGTCANYLVKGCKNDSSAPGAIQFNPGDRLCVLPENIRDYTPIAGGNYLDIMMHEAGGHGSDPDETDSNYPRGKLFRVNHGKWKALSQMFSVPGEFLFNPGDMMYPMLKRELGKVVGQTFEDSFSLTKILDKNGQAIILGTMLGISDREFIPLNNLKFSKRVCRAIGEAIVPRVLSHTIEIYGPLKDEYLISMANVCHEIYAEMVRYAILYPDQINNPIIFDGIGEIINAINGRVINLDEIRKKVVMPSQEIIDRYNAETAALSTGSKPEVSTLTPEDLKAIADQDAEVKKREQDIKNFLETGKIPDSLQVPSEYSEDMTKFAALVTEMNRRYPTLFGVDISGDDSYDPNLNLWEIEELGYAYDAPFIRGTLALDVVSAQVDGELKAKNMLLQKYLIMNVNLNP